MAPPSATTVDRAKSKNFRQLTRILSFVWPYKGRIAVAAVALLVSAGCVLALGQGLRMVIDRGLAAGDQRTLDLTLMALFLVVVLLGVSTAMRLYAVSWLGERVTADLRQKVYAHLLELSPGFFETTRTGEVISRLTNDTTVLEVVVGSQASFALRNIIMFFGSMVLLAITSPKLTLYVVVGVPLVIAPMLFYASRVRRLARANQDRVADVSAYIDESLHEIRTVQAYVHEPADRKGFGTRVESAFQAGVSRIRQRSLLVGMVMLLAFGAVGVILWIGGHDVLAGRISPGDLSAFVFYSVIMAGAVAAVSEVYGDLQRAAGATERIFELLDTVPTIAAPHGPVQRLPEPPRGEIVFDTVRFNYPSRPDVAALAGLSFTVNRGEQVALVGPSGAGKSTVFQLLLRFYDVSSGTIQIDGVDVRAVDPRAVRARCALVSQDPVIFAASVAENVRYARPDASDDEVRAACDAAYALEFIDRLPERFDTYLGERGVRLSGGQRQRLAIARALLADRPILLLDEATSSLDAESERAVQRALERLMHGRTALVVAHRLATVQRADRIVVLEAGQAVATGTHAELMQAQGLYARLAKLQLLAA